MAKAVSLDQPTRRSIEALLNELERGENYHDSEYYRLRMKMEELEHELLAASGEYQKLKSMTDAAERKYREGNQTSKLRARKLRQEYLLKGITPALLKKLNDFVLESAS